MSKIFQLEGGQYEHPNEYKLVSTVRGTTILQPEFGTVIIEGDVIEASTHNTIQKNGVLASKVNVTMESTDTVLEPTAITTDTVLVPTDMTIESDLFNELKIMLLFETGTTLPSNSFIKLKETNVPIANVNDYVVNANTPLLFLYFDSKFYAYKAGEGAIIKIATTAQVAAGTDNTTAVSPAKLKELFANGLNTATNGYQKLPGGLILQWGGATFRETTGATGQVIALPISFPNAFLRITGTDGGYGANAIGITIIGKSQFRCWGRNVSSAAFSDTGFHWIAIGY